jgi:ABC-2 type transport system permease protein
LSNTSLIEQNAISSSNVSGFHYVTVFPVYKGSDYKDNLTLSIISSRGIYIPQEGIYSASSSQMVIKGNVKLLSSSYSPITQTDVQDLIFSGISAIVGFFIAILSVFEGYLTYGKDRTSGVLESVLKRPVSRGALIASRFTANAVSIAIAVALSMLSADLLIHYYLGLYLSMTFDMYFIWSFFVEGAAFLALVYFFSHLVKSQGSLLGSAIGLFVVFGLFWSVVADVFIFAFHISSTSTAYVTTQIAFDYASPAGFSSLFQILFEKTLGSTFGSGLSINPALFGVIPAFIVLAGILWIAVPFIGAFTLATKRD